MNFLDLFYIIYLSFSVFIYFQFYLGNIGFRLYNKKTGEYEETSPIIQFIFITLFALAWPIALYYISKSRED